MFQYIFKNFKINVHSYSEVSGDGQGNDDWNIACEGFMEIDEETSTAIINEREPIN